MRKPFILFCIVGLFPLFASAQQTAKTQYQVDLVLFLHTSKSYRTEETWPKNIDLNWPEQYSLLLNNNEQAAVIEEQSKVMPSTKTTNANEIITADVSKLSKLPRYKIVDHLSFVTTLGKEKTATNWAIDKTLYDKHGQKNRLAGTFKLYKNRFLHIKTEFWLAIEGEEQTQENIIEIQTEDTLEQTKQTTATLQTEAIEEIEEIAQWPTLPARLVTLIDSTANIDENEFTNIELISKMTQHRKLRSKEKHYIDHPLFGVLVYITPIDP